MSPVLTTLRHTLLRAALRRFSPPIEAKPTDGGRGPHPLGTGKRAPWSSDTPSGLGGIALAALTAEHDPERALDRADKWLQADTAGHGPGWMDVDDIAIRLIHLAALYAWTAPPPEIARRITGSAMSHAASIAREVPLDRCDPDRPLCHAALVIAGLSWPALGRARSWWGGGLGALRTSLPAIVGPDGGPGPDPNRVARALWAGEIAQGWASAGGIGFPGAARAALLAGGDALWRIGGDLGNLPGEPPAPLLPLGPAPIAHTLRNLAVACGMAPGAPACSPDPACALLGGRSPDGEPEAMAGKHWSAWTWRSTGQCVGHTRISKQPARAWLTARNGGVSLQLGGRDLVRGQRDTPMQLETVLVDGPEFRTRFSDGDSRRDVQLRRARMRVTDRGIQSVRWDLGPGFVAEKSSKGWTATGPDTALAIELDPAWRWAWDGPILTGHGDPADIQSTFEVL